MENIINRSFGINLRIMKILRLYSEKQHSQKYTIILTITYFLLTFPVPILGMLYFIFDKNATMEEVSENAFVLTELGCYSIKLLPFIINAEEVKNCINFLEISALSVEKEKQKNIMNEAVHICRRNSLVFLNGIVGAYIFWMGKPFFLTRYKLPTNIWLPFDLLNKPFRFYSVYFCMAIEIAYPSLSVAVVDPLLAGLAYHAASQVAILRDNLEHLNEYADEQIQQSFTQKSKSEIIYEKIKQCIVHHDLILKFVKLYESCFSFVVFYQFVGGILSIGLCCLRLALFEPSNFNFFITVSYMGLILIQVYFYCYYGSELYEENNKLADAIYSSNWQEFDKKSRNALLVIMERSKRPMVITAGKLVDLSLQTFIMILKRSYSILAVLKNFQ